jgi:unsaturated rhamnogalacturonyl hydrolase
MKRMTPKSIFKISLTAALCLILSATAFAQQQPWSQRMANTAMSRWPDGRIVSSNADLGILLNGINAAWYNTADGDDYHYIQHSIDHLISPDGSIPNFNSKSDSPNTFALGRQLLLLYRVTQHKKYYTAALALHQAAPSQIPLDRLYSTEPFYAEYASVFHEPQDFAGITKQFVRMNQEARSPRAEARGMAWYMMALVDTLPYYPENDPGRAKLLAILNQNAAALVRHQDPKSGLWHETVNQPGAPGNSLAYSASRMFVYAFQKGVRLGYLPERYSQNAARVWQKILSQGVHTDSDGTVTLTPSDDAISTGAFMLAASEMEMAPQATLARGETVVVDAWFNSQQRTNAAGQKEYFHYKWSDYSNSGFSLLGQIFQSHGAKLAMLTEAPTLVRLRGAQIYFIVSPDIPKWNPNPNPVRPEDAEQVAEWVKQGGVLVLMENDPANANIEGLNLIANKFGLHFDNVLKHHVVEPNYAPGFIPVAGDGPIFHHPHTVYMKDTCGISVKAPATPVFSDKQGIVIASAKYGKGMAVAVIDPWLYNEYTDHRKLHPVQQNFAAGREFALWLIRQTQHNPQPQEESR